MKNNSNYSSVSELMSILGKGKTMIYQYIKEGKIIKKDNKYIILDDDLILDVNKNTNLDIVSFLKEELNKKEEIIKEKDLEIIKLNKQIARYEAMFIYIKHEYNFTEKINKVLKR